MLINHIKSFLGFLLDSEIVGVSALSLSAVSSLGRKSCIAISANLLLAVVLLSKSCDSRFHTTTSKSKNEVESRFLLDVVVRKSSAVFELFSSEDESLLIRGDSFLILDLSLHVVDGIRSLDIEGDRLSCKGLDENLHFLFFDFLF